MAESKYISSENLPLWTMAAFIVALLALLLGAIGIYRTTVVLYGTQLEVIALNKKIEALKAAPAQPAVAANEAQAAAK